MQEDITNQENPVPTDPENELTEGELDEVAGGSLFLHMLEAAQDNQNRQEEAKKLQDAADLQKKLLN